MFTERRSQEHICFINNILFLEIILILYSFFPNINFLFFFSVPMNKSYQICNKKLLALFYIVLLYNWPFTHANGSRVGRVLARHLCDNLSQTVSLCFFHMIYKYRCS